MSFIGHYGLFAAKLGTLIIGILITVAGVIYLVGREKRKGETGESPVTVTRINDKYNAMQRTLQAKVLDKEARKQAEKAQKHKDKTSDQESEKKKRIFAR